MIDDWRPRPTPAQIEAHHAAHASGHTSWWVTTYPDGVAKGYAPYVHYSTGDGLVWISGGGGEVSPTALWSPRDARLVPVAWPR